MADVPLREFVSAPEYHPIYGNKRAVLCFWHEAIIPATAVYATTAVPVLISQHRDGEMVAQVHHFMGGKSIRGSTTRGGGKALREMIKLSSNSSLAITPDGPRGPRRKMHQGAIFIASQAGIPIIPVGLHAKDTWRANSWDRTMIPRPGRPIYIVGFPPIHIPGTLSPEEMEQYRHLCELKLNEAQELAERYAKENARPSDRAFHL